MTIDLWVGEWYIIITKNKGTGQRPERKMNMKYQKMDNAELLKAFETLCFRITNYKTNKSLSKQFDNCEKEMCKRLGIPQNELKDI